MKSRGILNLLPAFLCFIFAFSCASAEKNAFENLVPGDQVASDEPVISAKKVELGRNEDGEVKGYKYVSTDDAEIFAMELIDEKGGRTFEGKIPDGLVVQYYDGGSVAAELNYNAGKLEGVIKEYYPDKSVAWVKNYKAGELNGPVKEYYANGNIKEDSVYSDGLLNGTLKKYSDTGTLLSTAEYQYGDLNGQCKEYYVNGKIKTAAEYMNGRKEGYLKEFDPAGILLAEYNYSMNKLEGISKKYYEDGSIQMIANYVNDVQEGETKIFSNNNSAHPIYIDIYKKGKKLKRKAYSAQGKLIFVLDC